MGKSFIQFEPVIFEFPIEFDPVSDWSIQICISESDGLAKNARAHKLALFHAPPLLILLNLNVENNTNER